MLERTAATSCLPEDSQVALGGVGSPEATGALGGGRVVADHDGSK